MSLIFLIYFAEFADKLSEAAAVTCWLFIAGTLIYWGIVSEGKAKMWTIAKCFIFSMLIWSIVVITPTSKTIYTMAAIKYGQEAIERPEVKILGDKVYKILNQKLDEMVDKKKK
jgi:hypothetical protein